MGRLNIGLPRGQRGTFDYFYQSMKAAVPLIRQKNELDYHKGRNDLQYNMGLEKLRQASETAKFEAAEATMQEQIKAMKEMREQTGERLQTYTKGARTAGDEKAAAAGQQAEVKAGFLPPGLPSFVGEGKSQSEMELLLNMSEEKFNLLSRRKKRLRKPDQPKNLSEAQYLMSLSDEEFETFASRKKKTQISAGTKELPSEKRAIEDKRRLEDDIQQVFTQLGGVEARQNITSAAMASQAPMVEARKKKRLKKMLANYEAKYGKQAALNRFGLISDDIGVAGSLESDDPLGLKRKK